MPKDELARWIYGLLILGVGAAFLTASCRAAHRGQRAESLWGFFATIIGTAVPANLFLLTISNQNLKNSFFYTSLLILVEVVIFFALHKILTKRSNLRKPSH